MSVWRDPWGVPHVRGGSVEELAREQGRVAAEDRGAQLEAELRRAQARFATLVGDDGREWDDFARRVDLDGVARRAFDRLGDESRAFVTAYAEGVRGHLPDWRDWSSLGVFWVQQVLFSTYPTKLWRRHVADRVGPHLVDLLRTEGLPAGSNAFAVSGARTASGLPLVAGDPHRVLEAAGVYHPVALSCPDFDVVGLSFAGVPGVQHFGHTGEVAWAVTNAMADYQDVGEDDALVSPAAVLGDLGFEALLGLLRARSVADVDAALEHWVEPVNNVVVADRAGRLLHRVAGRMPVRDDSGAWTGWAALPRVEPRDGVLVSANDRAAPDFAVLGDGFASPRRADRIRALLADREAVDVPDAAAVLTDDRQLAAEPLLDLAVEASGLSPAADRLRAELLAWDRRMAAESRGAALFAAVRAEVVERVVAVDELAPLLDPCPYGDLLAPWFDLRVRVASALPVLLRHERPLGLDLPSVVAAALEAVAAAPPTGTWGDRHRFAPVPVPGVEPTGVGTPLSGDTECVAATGWLPGTDACVRGPAARYVFDLADRSRSRWAVPEGALLARWATGELAPVEPFTLEHVDPARDAAMIHAWVTQPRAAFWGMLERTRDEVEEIYRYIDEQEHLSAQLIRLDGVPVGIVQTYDPFVDEIGEHYDRQPGDVGIHLFLADVPERAGTTESITAWLVDRAFADERVRRLVLEPDVGNQRSLGLARRLGAHAGPVVDLPEKTAQFAFITR